MAFPFAQVSTHFNYVKLSACASSDCAGDATGATCGVTDSRFQTYILISQVTTAGSRALICTFYAANVSSGGNTITCSLTVGTGTPYYLGCEIIEFSGIVTSSPLDVTGIANGTSTALSATTSGATTHTNELLIGSGFSLAGAGTAGSPYVFVNNVTANNEFKTVSSTGTQTATITAPSGDWVMTIQTFQCAAACPMGGTGLTPATPARGFFTRLP